MADADSADLTAFFDTLPKKVRAELADTLKGEAEGLAQAIKDAAPEGETDALKRSVRVEQEQDDLHLAVAAGGEMTTKSVRQGSGQTYDYALAVEFGTSKMAAEPFFFPTYEARRGEIEARISEAVEKAIAKA